MQTTAIGKEAKIKTETQAGRAVAQDDSVDLAALPRRQSSARLARGNLNWEGRRGSSVFGLIWHHFARRGKELMERPKPFSHMHLRRAVDADLEAGAGRGSRRGDSASRRRARGRGFGFEFGRWLAIFTGRLRSLNPCGIRARDEYTKRSGRSVWTAEHGGRG